jgi:hypothetical protein
MFHVYTKFFHVSINQTNINQTRDHKILFLASDICSSFHDEAIIFIHAIIITNIAITNIAASIKETIPHNVLSKVVTSKKILFQLISDQDDTFQSIEDLVQLNELYKVQGILINTNHIIVYHICLFAVLSFSSSFHIDIIICIHANTKNITSKPDTTYLIRVNISNQTFSILQVIFVPESIEME